MSGTMDLKAGTLLYDALEEAHRRADESGVEIVFDFNEDRFDARPDESFEDTLARAEKRTGHKIRNREEIADKARLDLEESNQRTAAAIEEAGVANEREMREADVPWPGSEEELIEYVASLVDRPHDYGTCVYAMSMAAVAAYRYVAKKLGVTGFQAGCADLDILRRTRRMKHGFKIIDFSDLLYPQHRGKIGAAWDELIEENRERLAEAARELLAGNDGSASPRVVAHWRWLAREALDAQEASR